MENVGFGENPGKPKGDTGALVLLKWFAELLAPLLYRSPEQASGRALKQHPGVCWLPGRGRGAGLRGQRGQVVPAREMGLDLPCIKHPLLWTQV